jgi:hypothetical protein
MLNRVPRKMRQGSVSGMVKNREGVAVANIFVRIHEPANNFVVAIRRKSILIVIIAGNGFGIEAIQSQHFLAGRFVACDGVHARQRRYPLTEGATRGESIRVAILVIRVVAIPAANVFAGTGLAAH